MVSTLTLTRCEPPPPPSLRNHHYAPDAWKGSWRKIKCRKHLFPNLNFSFFNWTNCMNNFISKTEFLFSVLCLALILLKSTVVPLKNINISLARNGVDSVNIGVAMKTTVNLLLCYDMHTLFRMQMTVRSEASRENNLNWTHQSFTQRLSNTTNVATLESSFKK